MQGEGHSNRCEWPRRIPDVSEANLTGCDADHIGTLGLAVDRAWLCLARPDVQSRIRRAARGGSNPLEPRGVELVGLARNWIDVVLNYEADHTTE